MAEDKGSTGDTQEPPKGSLWPLVAMILLTFWLCRRQPATDPQVVLRQCADNLHQIGVTLERYRLTSDDGLYPSTLEEAYKGKTLPICKANGDESYKSGYQPSTDRHSYLLVCKGDKHADAGVPSNYPRIAFSVPESPPHDESSASSHATPAAVASP